jgi:hypothetical protein
MENIGIFYGHLEYIMAIWYITWPFGSLVVFSLVLVYCITNNLASLGRIR